MLVYVRFSNHGELESFSGVFASLEAAMRDTCNFRGWRKLTEDEAGPYNVWIGSTYDEDSEGDMVRVGEARIYEEEITS